MSENPKDPVEPEPDSAPPSDSNETVNLTDKELRATSGGFIIAGTGTGGKPTAPTGTTITPFTPVSTSNSGGG